MVDRYDVVRARSLDPGEELALAREAWVRVPPGFEATLPSPRPSVEATYREDRPTGPLRIRRSADGVAVRCEHYHPGYHPVKHLRYDRLPAGVLDGLDRGATLAGRLVARLRRVAAVQG